MTVVFRILIAGSLLATVASTLSVYPHQLAYFNEAAGGPENGHKHLLGSNFDWGQDFLHLNAWMRSENLSTSDVVVRTEIPYPVVTFFARDAANSRECRWEALTAPAFGNAIGGSIRKTRKDGDRIGCVIWIRPLVANDDGNGAQ